MNIHELKQKEKIKMKNRKKEINIHESSDSSLCGRSNFRTYPSFLTLIALLTSSVCETGEILIVSMSTVLTFVSFSDSECSGELEEAFESFLTVVLGGVEVGVDESVDPLFVGIGWFEEDKVLFGFGGSGGGVCVEVFDGERGELLAL